VKWIPITILLNSCPAINGKPEANYYQKPSFGRSHRDFLLEVFLAGKKFVVLPRKRSGADHCDRVLGKFLYGERAALKFF
jgi:hypothetical protein